MIWLTPLRDDPAMVSIIKNYGASSTQAPKAVG
jgi:hypothetical protein